MNLEKALLESNNADLLTKLYSAFSQQGLGREIVLFARKTDC
jgi:hypothetical protein